MGVALSSILLISSGETSWNRNSHFVIICPNVGLFYLSEFLSHFHVLSYFSPETAECCWPIWNRRIVQITNLIFVKFLSYFVTILSHFFVTIVVTFFSCLSYFSPETAERCWPIWNRRLPPPIGKCQLRVKLQLRQYQHPVSDNCVVFLSQCVCVTYFFLR